jgi:hypothetical protein
MTYYETEELKALWLMVIAMARIKTHVDAQLNEIEVRIAEMKARFDEIKRASVTPDDLRLVREFTEMFTAMALKAKDDSQLLDLARALDRVVEARCRLN